MKCAYTTGSCLHTKYFRGHLDSTGMHIQTIPLVMICVIPGLNGKVFPERIFFEGDICT